MTLRENALTLTCKHVPLSTCIIYIVFRNVEKIELNRIDFNRIMWFPVCFVCSFFDSLIFTWHIGLFVVVAVANDAVAGDQYRIVSNIFFGIEQKNNGTKKYKWHLKRKWADAWTMYACKRNEHNRMKRKNRDEKSRAYVGPSVGQLIIDSYYYYTWCYSYSSLKWIACWIQNKKRNET